MKLTNAEFTQLLSVCSDLGLLSKTETGHTFNNSKMEIFIKHVDNLKALYEEWNRLHNEGSIKTKRPAIHKIHGTILVTSTSVGVKNNVLANTIIKCVNQKGEKLELPYDEVVPYNTTTEVLFGDNKDNVNK